MRILGSASGLPRRPDVVAARWDGDGRLYSVAVECKVTQHAALDAVGQAVEYQGVFDEVYIATQLDLGSESVMHSTLVDLGIGHLRVASPTVEFAELTVSPRPRWTSRLQPQRKRHLDASLAVGLAFMDSWSQVESGTFGTTDPIFGMWYAHEIRDRLQWNCWYGSTASDEVESGSGINIEFRPSIARLLARIKSKSSDVDVSLHSLPDDYKIRMSHRPNRDPEHPDPVQEVRRANEMKLADIQAWFAQAPTGWRCQLEVMRPLRTPAVIAKDRVESDLSEIRVTLGPLMNLLAASESTVS